MVVVVAVQFFHPDRLKSLVPYLRETLLKGKISIKAVVAGQLLWTFIPGINSNRLVSAGMPE